jgi:DNA-binding CsgD family transcriptional regulator/PAS domain-containing protein
MESAFTKAVEAIYAAAPEPARWPSALQAIANAFDDVGALMVWEREDRTFGAVESASLTPLIQEYVRDFNGHDLRSMRGAERRYYLAGEAVTDLDVVSPSEMEAHPFYKFLARHGLKYFVGTYVSPDPRVRVSIAVQRAIRKPPYSEGERACMVRLGRHAEASLRLSIRLLDAEFTNLGLRDALSRLGIGVFALDSFGRIVFSNPAGDRLLGDGLLVVNGRLRVGPSSARNDIESAIAQALQSEGFDRIAQPRPMLVERPSAARPLTIYVLPLSGVRTPEQEFLTYARALILAIDPGDGEPPDPALVRDVLGLTLSEARLAALVGTGLGTGQAAKRLGITEGTARTALKRVFQKVGVSRQSELAALLTKLILR